MSFKLKIATKNDLVIIKRWLEKQKQEREEKEEELEELEEKLDKIMNDSSIDDITYSQFLQEEPFTFLCNFHLTTRVCDDNRLLVYYDLSKNIPIGYLWMDFWIMELKEDYQNKGIGSKFVKEALKYLKNNTKERCLKIECNSEKTRNFWKKMEFTFYSKNKGYYVIEENLKQPKDGLNVKVIIKTYLNSRNWNKNDTEPTKIIKRDGIKKNNTIYLSKSVVLPNLKELWNGDLYLEIFVDNILIFQEKAKRKEATDMGIKDIDSSFVIKQLKLLN